VRRVLLATGAGLGLLLLFAAPAAAQTLPDIIVDERVPTTGRAAPGSVHLVALTTWTRHLSARRAT